jgi:hypothetical protein
MRPQFETGTCFSAKTNVVKLLQQSFFVGLQKVGYAH